MKCRYCGYEIPDGVLYCERCGKEVRIVPDYNPLDDVLAAQIRGSIDGTDTPLDDYEYVESRTAQRRNTNPGGRRNTNPGARRTTSPGTRTGTDKRRNTNSGRRTGRMTGDMRSDREQRRRQAERKKALKRKKRQRACIILGVLAVILGILIFVLYQNSYTGQIKKGYKSMNSKEYEKAAEYFEKAISKKPKKADAYTGLSKVYIALDDLDAAENTFLKAIDKYPENADIYEACILFYVDTKQEAEVSVLLDEAEESVVKQLGSYVSTVPSFSLDDAEVFDDVQQLSLETEEKEIYYTTDGSAPAKSSTKYTEPIQIEEGENVITAISINKKGIPSLPKSKTYIVEFPVEDAPAVNPSTGQYDVPTQITINVPEGYEAYYTTDKSDPTAESTKYEGPIDMPAGSTIFKAILVNGKGRTSGITTRNYELTTE